MGKRIHDTSNSASEEELDFTIRDTSDEEQHTEDLEPFEQQFLAIRRKNLKPIEPLYESDTSDDEFTNTIGNVPPEWYDDFPHVFAV
jgi:ribosome biogenesis protein ERB1